MENPSSDVPGHHALEMNVGHLTDLMVHTLASLEYEQRRNTPNVELVGQVPVGFDVDLDDRERRVPCRLFMESRRAGVLGTCAHGAGDAISLGLGFSVVSPLVSVSPPRVGDDMTLLWVVS